MKFLRNEPSTEWDRRAPRSTVGECLTSAVNRLRESGDAPQLEAEVLLAQVLGCNRAYLHAHPELPLRPGQIACARTLVARRAAGEPLPYIIGKKEFYGLPFFVDDRVLIPRPETETLVDSAIRLLQNSLNLGLMRKDRCGKAWRPKLADVGTGSGCIAVSIARLVSNIHIYAMDISSDALDVAAKNARKHRVSEKITFIQSNLLENLPERVDLVISNPPYIATTEWSSLPSEVREYEPQLALHGGHDGLDCVRRLLEQAAIHLLPGGAVLVEIGASQAGNATDLAHVSFPGAEVTTLRDMANRERVLLIQTRSDAIHKAK